MLCSPMIQTIVVQRLRLSSSQQGVLNDRMLSVIEANQMMWIFLGCSTRTWGKGSMCFNHKYHVRQDMTWCHFEEDKNFSVFSLQTGLLNKNLGKRIYVPPSSISCLTRYHKKSLLKNNLFESTWALWIDMTCDKGLSKICNLLTPMTK